MMWSDCGWCLGEGANFQFSWGTKNWGLFASSGRRSSLVQLFCQSCVHFHLAHVAVHMVLRSVIQGCPTLEGTPLEILFSVSDAMKKTAVHFRAVTKYNTYASQQTSFHGRWSHPQQQTNNVFPYHYTTTVWGARIILNASSWWITHCHNCLVVGGTVKSGY